MKCWSSGATPISPHLSKMRSTCGSAQGSATSVNHTTSWRWPGGRCRSRHPPCSTGWREPGPARSTSGSSYRPTACDPRTRSLQRSRAGARCWKRRSARTPCPPRTSRSAAASSSTAWSPRGLEIDHVLLATRDLAVAADVLRRRYGLESVEGGRHPDWGTANRIVPVGAAYLELVTVVDETIAGRSPFGRWVASADPLVAQPIGWAVRTSSIDTVATRQGVTVHAGSRAAPSGQILRWALAGVDQAAAEPCRPFFIQWGEGTPHPSQALSADTSNSTEIVRLELEGDADRLDRWLGGDAGAITIRPGPPAVASVILATPSGEARLDATLH
jgi:Glyoxalase-like domain